MKVARHALCLAALALPSPADAKAPRAPVPSVSASTDPEVIARGRYLSTAVEQCSLCHGAVPADGTEPTDLDSPLSGGLTWKVPGFVTMVAANISPDPDGGVGAWSDGELARVIRFAVGPDDKLRPLMFFHVGPMGDQDLQAVVSWIRSTPPDPTVRPEEKMSLLGRLFLSSIKPRDGTGPPFVPEGEASIGRGRYLAEGPANCGMCHSPMKGLEQVEPRFSGGTRAEVDLHEAGMEWLAPNLTPDPETGRIAAWSEEQFVARFQAGTEEEHPLMPWNAYRHMTEEDLASIYRYLMSLPPTEHETGPGHRERGWKPEKNK